MYERKQPIPSDEEIRARSYMIWEREGHPEGKSEEHWQRARAELAAEHTASMPFRKQPVLSEVNVRARAYMIWEHEGRLDGKAKVHWLRAKAELEDEFLAECAAYVEGKPATFAMPLLEISSPPTLTESVLAGPTAKSTEPLRLAS